MWPHDEHHHRNKDIEVFVILCVRGAVEQRRPAHKHSVCEQHKDASPGRHRSHSKRDGHLDTKEVSTMASHAANMNTHVPDRQQDTTTSGRRHKCSGCNRGRQSENEISGNSFRMQLSRSPAVSTVHSTSTEETVNAVQSKKTTS